MCWLGKAVELDVNVNRDGSRRSPMLSRGEVAGSCLLLLRINLLLPASPGRDIHRCGSMGGAIKKEGGTRNCSEISSPYAEHC
jgi:hypothetical protein